MLECTQRVHETKGTKKAPSFKHCFLLTYSSLNIEFKYQIDEYLKKRHNLFLLYAKANTREAEKCKRKKEKEKRKKNVSV